MCNVNIVLYIAIVTGLYLVDSWKKNIQHNSLRTNRIVSCHFILRRNTHAYIYRRFFLSNIFAISCYGFVSLSYINTPILSLTHPSIHSISMERSAYIRHSPTRMIVFLPFLFRSGVRSAVREMMRWWVHLRPNKKKCLQSVVVVVSNGLFHIYHARLSKQFSSRFLMNYVCEWSWYVFRGRFMHTILKTSCLSFCLK